MIDELLQVAELRARRDVEASAVQLPDLVVLHIQPFGVVVVQDRQTVGTWKGKASAEINHRKRKLDYLQIKIFLF